MNEFIVWSEKDKHFLDYCTVMQTAFNNDGFSLLYRVFNEDNFQVFGDIGKTDINNKKIYADCSVVEFEVVDENGTYMVSGYFKYDKHFLLYMYISTHGEEYTFEDIVCRQFKNMKIIDTIQENKLGLIK